LADIVEPDDERQPLGEVGDGGAISHACLARVRLCQIHRKPALDDARYQLTRALRDSSGVRVDPEGE